MRRRPRAGAQGVIQKKTDGPYKGPAYVRPQTSCQPVDETKIWPIGNITKTAFELTAACSNDIKGHELCSVPKVKDLDDAVTDEGDFWDKQVTTILQEAVLHMVIREKGARIAEHIGTEMLDGGAGQEMATYLGARGDMIKPSVVPSEDDFRLAILHRYENCHVAKKSMKASGHRRICYETNQQDFVDARQRRAWQKAFSRMEKIIKTVRAQRVHNADRLIEQKMVVAGDSTAAELGESLSDTAKITGKNLASVRTVLVVAGRDAMLDDDTVETFVGQCEKLAGMLGSYPSIKIYWMIPPFVSDKAEKYEDIATSLIDMLERTKFEIVATRGLRSFAEIFRFGGRHNRFYADNSGALTDTGRVQVLEYLREMHRFPLNDQKQKDQGMKRAYESGRHGDRDVKQYRSSYEKRREEPQFEGKGHCQRRKH